MSPDIIPIRRALISVSDKTGLIDHAKALSSLGAALVSTGGTRKAIADAGLAVSDVSAVTGFPEMMDGRVKTLHPKVHGGLLALRDNAEHTSAMKEHGIEAFDVLYVNLYPFEETVARGADFDTCIENIDIGGPAMIRAAAKNYGFIAVATDADDMAAILEEAKAHGGTTLALRKKLAAKAFARTGAYDAAISSWYADQLGETTPTWRSLGGKLKQSLRYGENPHQHAAFYTTAEQRFGVATAKQLQGKELSYNNLNDTDAAFELVSEFDPSESAAVAIIKHANPCGVATGGNLLEAYQRALECDSTSAFGGIVALNRRLDKAAAEAIADIFTEVVIAPEADEDAVAVFAKKKNLRLLVTGGLPNPATPGLSIKTIAGGFLAQNRDNGRVSAADLKFVTKKQPTDAQVRDMIFAFKVAKHVRSEERRVGKECRRLCRSRWSPYH
jgi:phosphoribosylaminoimidazolecarboxamide formyltransferase/IMP cyclohydrolase